MNENDVFYLEKLFPHLFPYDRGGPNEKRIKPISWKAYIAYVLNLYQGLFNNTEFILTAFNLKVRKEMATKAFVRAKLPSSTTNAEGFTMSRAETYRQISPQDMTTFIHYMEKCSEALKKGIHRPPHPSTSNKLPNDFLTDVRLACDPMPHTPAASLKNCLNMYAAHHSNGKADVWLTVTPRDDISYRIVQIVLVKEKTKTYELKMPSEDVRNAMLSEKPASAALHFERTLQLIIDKVVGWDSNNGRSHSEGGLIGKPKAFVRVVEEQGRNIHILIRLEGHGDLQEKFESISKGDHISSKACIENLLTKLSDHIRKEISGELALPELEMNCVTKCPSETCIGELQLVNDVI